MSADLIREAVAALRGAANKCCQCTDGHHDWQGVYGTEGDVRISRDAALAIADWLENESLAREMSGRDGLTYGPALTTTRALLGGES